MKKVINDLFDYNNRKIYQYNDTFKFSLDSILLSEFVDINNKKNTIVDLCTGLGPIPLVLSTKTNNKIYGIEIQKEIAALAKETVKYNKLNNQIEIIYDDIKNINNYFSKKSIDIITCNPPFFKVEKNSIVNECEIEKNSRHEFLIDIESIFEISSSILKDNGVLYLVHRPERIDDIIILAAKYNINVKKIVYIATNNDYDLKTILVKCVKNSKKGVKTSVTNIHHLSTYKDIFKGDRK